MVELVYVAVAILFVAVIVEGLVLVGVMRQVGALLLQVRPEVARDVGGGPDLNEAVDLGQLALKTREGGVLVAFMSPNCELCEVLRPALQALPVRHPALTTSVAVVYGSAEERALLASELGDVARLDLATLAELWSVPGTPYVVSLDGSGHVRAKGVVNTIEQLDAMVEHASLPPDDDRPSSAEPDARRARHDAEAIASNTERVREEVSV